MTGYAELHARSAFSFLRGASLPEEYAETAASLEIPAMALPDREGVYEARLSPDRTGTRRDRKAEARGLLSRGILVQGRGPAANSAVCYSLGITTVDPRLCLP